MINSNGVSIFRLFFLVVLTSAIIDDIIQKKGDWIYPALLEAFLIAADFFVNQKVLMGKRNYYIFKHFLIKKYDYKDTKKIILLEEEIRYGTDITLYFLLKNEVKIKVNIGCKYSIKQIEKKLKNICKDKCIKFIFID